jgi:hypothetical protein
MVTPFAAAQKQMAAVSLLPNVRRLIMRRAFWTRGGSCLPEDGSIELFDDGNGGRASNKQIILRKMYNPTLRKATKMIVSFETRVKTPVANWLQNVDHTRTNIRTWSSAILR